jgi:hypothetical protein
MQQLLAEKVEEQQSAKGSRSAASVASNSNEGSTRAGSTQEGSTQAGAASAAEASHQEAPNLHSIEAVDTVEQVFLDTDKNPCSQTYVGSKWLSSVG